VVPRRCLAILHRGQTEPVRVELQRLADAEPEVEPIVLTTAPAELRGWYCGALAPSPGRYLLSGLPRGRAGAGLLFAARAARVLRAAHCVRRDLRQAHGVRRDGRAGSTPADIAAFLDALQATERLVLAAEGRDPRPTARAVALTTRLAALTLGVKTVRPGA